MKKGPIYLQVAEKIKEDILNGVYPVGSLLPTELEFEEMFKVSKITIRNAISILANEGYVVKKSGKGTTVITNQIYSRLSKAASFTELLKRNHTVETQILAFDTVENSSDKEKTDLFGPKYNRLVKLYFVDGKPYMHREFFFDYFEINHERDIAFIEKFSIYRYLAEKSYLIESFTDDLEVAKAPQEIRDLLELSDECVLARHRKVYNEDKKVVGASTSYYNTAIHPYSLEFEV